MGGDNDLVARVLRLTVEDDECDEREDCPTELEVEAGMDVANVGDTALVNGEEARLDAECDSRANLEGDLEHGPGHTSVLGVDTSHEGDVGGGEACGHTSRTDDRSGEHPLPVVCADEARVLDEEDVADDRGEHTNDDGPAGARDELGHKGEKQEDGERRNALRKDADGSKDTALAINLEVGLDVCEEVDTPPPVDVEGENDEKGDIGDTPEGGWKQRKLLGQVGFPQEEPGRKDDKREEEGDEERGSVEAIRSAQSEAKHEQNGSGEHKERTDQVETLPLGNVGLCVGVGTAPSGDGVEFYSKQRVSDKQIKIIK